MTTTKKSFIALGVLVLLVIVRQSSAASAGTTIAALLPLVLLVLVVRWLLKPRKPSAKPMERMLGAARANTPGFLPSLTIGPADASSGAMLDGERNRVFLYADGGRHSGMFSPRQILKTEIVEDGSTVASTVRTSQAASALVGGLLLGGVGGLIGGLTGKKRSTGEVSEILLHVGVADSNYPLYVVPVFSSRKPVPKSTQAVKQALLTIQQAQALLAAMIRAADEADRVEERAQTPPPQDEARSLSATRANFSDEFIKLAKLRADGVLSESEFGEMKAALIARAKLL